MARSKGIKNHVLCGVAVNDAGYNVVKTKKEDGKKKRLWICPYYQTWSNMITRSLSSNYKKNHPTYKDVKVCKEWLIFSNFKAWMEQQDWEGKELDKDLLGDGKLYSPDTCCFLPLEINSFLVTKKGSGDKKYPIGAYFSKQSGKIQARCFDPFKKKDIFLGHFDNPHEAHLAWKSYKHTLAITYSEKETDKRVSLALQTRFLE